jgi:uncharacterized protein
MSARTTLAVGLLAALASAEPSAANDVLARGFAGHGQPAAAVPLPERADTVAWRELRGVQVVPGQGSASLRFPASAQRLTDRRLRFQGWMMALENGPAPRRFLLVSVTPDCATCIPTGPDGYVEVLSSAPVPLVDTVVVMEGRFVVRHDDPFGMYYRLSDARKVP